MLVLACPPLITLEPRAFVHWPSLNYACLVTQWIKRCLLVEVRQSYISGRRLPKYEQQPLCLHVWLHQRRYGNARSGERCVVKMHVSVFDFFVCVFFLFLLTNMCLCNFLSFFSYMCLHEYSSACVSDWQLVFCKLINLKIQKFVINPNVSI